MDEQQQQQQQQKHNTKFRQKYDVITTATQDQHSVLQTTTATAADTTTDTRYIHTHTALQKTHNNQPHTQNDGTTETDTIRVSVRPWLLQIHKHETGLNDERGTGRGTGLVIQRKNA